MPPRVRISKEMILNAALSLTREKGAGAVTAKAVAARLNCSTQPVFWHYENMEALKRDVFDEALKLFGGKLRRNRSDCRSPYMGVGLNYIEFAAEEKELFRMLFMSDFGGTDRVRAELEKDYVVSVIELSDGVTGAAAEDIYRTMWLFSHGIAAMTVTGTARFSDGEIRKMLSGVYRGLLRSEI